MAAVSDRNAENIRQMNKDVIDGAVDLLELLNDAMTPTHFRDQHWWHPEFRAQLQALVYAAVHDPLIIRIHIEGGRAAPEGLVDGIMAAVGQIHELDHNTCIILMSVFKDCMENPWKKYLLKGLEQMMGRAMGWKEAAVAAPMEEKWARDCGPLIRLALRFLGKVGTHPNASYTDMGDRLGDPQRGGGKLHADTNSMSRLCVVTDLMAFYQSAVEHMPSLDGFDPRWKKLSEKSNEWKLFNAFRAAKRFGDKEAIKTFFDYEHMAGDELKLAMMDLVDRVRDYPAYKEALAETADLVRPYEAARQSWSGWNDE